MSAKPELQIADISINNQGSIFLFRPLNTVAREHLVTNCPDAHWLGGALVCEHRYAADLAADSTNR